MLLESYWDHVDSLYEKIRTTQRENIIKAGRMVADSVCSGGCVFLSRICHGVQYDLIYRGGGPIFYKEFSYGLNIKNERVRTRDTAPLAQSEEGLARYALARSAIRPGDVLFVSSVSGRSLDVVDLAYEAQKMGVKVIALTSMEYARKVDTVHSSGKKLYEIASLTIDQCAPAAEAMMDVPGIEAKYAAASGIASEYIMWSLTTVAVEEMLKRGKTPGILKSANYPGGNDYNKKVIEPHYNQYGF